MRMLIYKWITKSPSQKTSMNIAVTQINATKHLVAQKVKNKK
jgi:hypothetical protein